MKAVHVSELDALSLPQFGFLWRPVRASLGVEGFGVNAYTAREPGGELIALLPRAFELEPKAPEQAKTDSDLDPLRDGPASSARVLDCKT